MTPCTHAGAAFQTAHIVPSRPIFRISGRNEIWENERWGGGVGWVKVHRRKAMITVSARLGEGRGRERTNEYTGRRNKRGNKQGEGELAI